MEISTGYLPRDKNDTHCLIRLIELRKTLKTLLEGLEKADEVSKDTLVLLPGIINTLSPGAQAFTLSPKI
ncbi:unnamed protein product [Mortierella alpina]